MAYVWESRKWRQNITTKVYIDEDGDNKTWELRLRPFSKLLYSELVCIKTPQPSGLAAILDGTDEYPGLLDNVLNDKAQKECEDYNMRMSQDLGDWYIGDSKTAKTMKCDILESMFELLEKQDENMYRKQLCLDRMMRKIDIAIQAEKIKKGDKCILQDLQGLWYILYSFIKPGDFKRSASSRSTDKFLDEYWAILEPSLREHMPMNTSVLEGLLLSQGIGPINPDKYFPGTQRAADCLEIEQHMSLCFKRASSIMKDIDSMFHFRAVKVGSLGEGCKIGFCDEFDMRIEFYHIDLVSQLKGSTSIIQITDLCADYTPSLNCIHGYFMETLSSLCGTDLTEKLRLLVCSDSNKAVPFLLFRWTPEPSSQEFALIKVDCALTIPCAGVWPGDKRVDPLGRPITPIAHLMLPNINSREHNSWRWSVCAAQQEFFRTLPKYVHLGYVITKIICSDALYPSSSRSRYSAEKPSTYCLKSCLFNAVANRELVIIDSAADRNALILQAIQVADIILAGLNKAQFGYFNDGEPVEHVHMYTTDIYDSGILAHKLLHKLIQDHIQHAIIKAYVCKHKDKTIAEILQVAGHKRKWTKVCVQMTNCGIDIDLEELRVMLGLLKPEVPETDSLKRVATGAASKWAHHIPDTLCQRLLRLPAYSSLCITDMEAARSELAQWNLTHKLLDTDYFPVDHFKNHFFLSVIKYGFHTKTTTESNMWSSCRCYMYCVKQKHQVFDTVGAAYRCCESAIETVMDELSCAIAVDLTDRIEGERQLIAIMDKYQQDIHNQTNELRFIFKKHCENLNRNNQTDIPELADSMMRKPTLHQSEMDGMKHTIQQLEQELCGVKQEKQLCLDVINGMREELVGMRKDMECMKQSQTQNS